MNTPSTQPARRAIIAGLCFALSLAVVVFAPGAPALAAGPQQDIRGFYATLLVTMKEGPTLGQSGRYARLAPVIGRIFDIPLMTRVSVGPSWGSLSPIQQQRVTAAFAHYVAATYADRFDSYSGQRLEVTGEKPYGEQVMVQTKIVGSDQNPVGISYLMRQNRGSWQISDVYLDGTISQLATQRSEFHSILRREGVDGLIMTLNRKVDLLTQQADTSP
jgi:phospholipid transport system substrate-binding protein